MNNLGELTLPVVITGISPNGLGEAMAHALVAGHPEKLVFTARSLHKADAVAAHIKRMYPSQEILTVQMDLSSMESVRAASTDLLKVLSNIDIVINNAGVMAVPKRTLSVDGYELHFATNFLGHFLFTNILQRRFAQNVRVVNVTSGGYMVCPIRFHDLNWDGKKDLPMDQQPNMLMARSLGIGELASPDSYNPMLAYLHSNAATMLFTSGYNKHFENTGAIAISAAPGGEYCFGGR